MTLTALQAHNIEKALIAGKTIDAVKLYREATGCSLVEAKTAIDEMKAALVSQKPWHFKDDNVTPAAAEGIRRVSRGKGLILFLLIDALIFAGVIYYFFVRDSGNDQSSPAARPAAEATVTSEGRPKTFSLPSQVDIGSYFSELADGETFGALYQRKIADRSYIKRRSGKDTDYDSNPLEAKIKTARSRLALQRRIPAGVSATMIPTRARQPSIDGIINEAEWQDAKHLMLDDDLKTRLSFKTDGQWLFIAADVPAEISAGGYDQLRVYFHAGLVEGLSNERVHIGRGPGITSIRQTQFRWQGPPSDEENERWKKYPVTDWGIYRYAYGASSMRAGHRQYEAALHLAEAGLHAGIPFTVYAEVETDPLKSAQGKFVERQYLGELGDENNPHWLQFQ